MKASDISIIHPPPSARLDDQLLPILGSTDTTPEDLTAVHDIRLIVAIVGLESQSSLLEQEQTRGTLSQRARPSVR